ncbi:hypothetical protein [Nocardia tengchongensis]|uniref:hypothetical protein n=1 Tax=Nocardia tengchongensis TaxID=2055889 RepID=UPI0036130A80
MSVTDVDRVVVSFDVVGTPGLITGLQAGVVVDAALALLVETDPVTVVSSWQAVASMTAVARTTAEISALTGAIRHISMADKITQHDRRTRPKSLQSRR